MLVLMSSVPLGGDLGPEYYKADESSCTWSESLPNMQ